MNSNSHKPFSVDLRAEVKRGRKMLYIVEVSIPVRTVKEAERLQKPFCDEIIRAVRLNHRRQQRSAPCKSSRTSPGGPTGESGATHPSAITTRTPRPLAGEMSPHWSFSHE